MNIKQILSSVKDQLQTQDGFRSAGLSTPMLRELVKEHVNSTYPLELFLVWLERCPEAQARLDLSKPIESGSAQLTRILNSPVPQRDAVFAEDNTAPLLPTSIAPSGPRPKQFRARIGDRMSLVELVKVDPGGTIMVKEVGVASYGGMVVLDRSCVAQEHTAQVAKWIEEMTPKETRWEDGKSADAKQA
jgi:hypothetical protein